jgi:hypothetical protein
MAGDASGGTEATKPTGCAMKQQYTVGMTVNRKSDHVNVEAEDALVAALKVKLDKPTAQINYVRPKNKRGDRRHPSHEISELPG